MAFKSAGFTFALSFLRDLPKSLTVHRTTPAFKPKGKTEENFISIFKKNHIVLKETKKKPPSVVE